MKMRFLLPLLVCLTASSAALADLPLLFISAFAPGEKGAIHSFKFDPTNGSLEEIARNTEVSNPFFLAVSKDNRFLYATYSKQFGGKENEHISSYALEGRSGKLRSLNQESSHGRATCYVTVDATGHSVLAANYSSGTVASLFASEDGTLHSATSVFQHEVDPLPAAADTSKQKPKQPNAHCIVVSPDNRFALSADLGADKIFIYKLDAATARLTPNEAQREAKLPAGSGPRHLIFNKAGNRVYVINELNNTVSFFRYDPDTGVLTLNQTISTLPDDFAGNSFCADLKLGADETFLYGTNRGHDSVVIFRVGADGALLREGIEPSLGKGPQNLLVTPEGKWLLCANMAGDNVAVFSIDPSSGKLKSAGTPTPMPRPSCIRMVP